MLEGNSGKIMESFSITGLLLTSLFAVSSMSHQLLTVPNVPKYIAYSILVAIYNVTLHPLSKFPGPKLYGAFHFPNYWDIYTGNTVHVSKKLHEIYGPVLRVTPNRLTFITAQAFTGINILEASPHHRLTLI